MGPDSDLNYDKKNNPTYWAWRLTARRSMEISNIFRQVYGDANMMKKIRPILAGQVSWSEGMKSGLKYIEEVYGNPSDFFYGISGAPYFNIARLDNNNNLGVDDVLNGLAADVDALKTNVALLDYVTLARFYNLKLTAYEAGPDTFGPNNIQSKKTAQFHPRMEKICEDFLAILYTYGFDLVNWFVVGPTNCNTQYGCWGVSEIYTNSDTPKMRALTNTMNKPKFEINIGISVPGSIDGRQIVGNNYYGQWQYAGVTMVFSSNPDLPNNVFFLVRSLIERTYYLQLHVSTYYVTRIKVEVNNHVVSIITVGNTIGSIMAQEFLAASFTEGLNAIRLTALDNWFFLNHLSVTTRPM